MSDFLRILAIFVARAGQRGLRRGRVRTRDGATDAARAGGRGRQPQGSRRPRPDGAPRPVHQHGPDRDHRVRDRPRRCRPAPALRLLRPVAVVRDRLRARVPDPHLPQRHARRARAEGDRASAGRERSRRPSRSRSGSSSGSSRRSSGCCRSRPNAVTRLFGVTPAPAGELAHTEEDIRHIVAGAEDAGVIATTEEEMLYKVFDFADKEVHEVMVPRPAGGRDLGLDAHRGGARGAA